MEKRKKDCTRTRADVPVAISLVANDNTDLPAPPPGFRWSDIDNTTPTAAAVPGPNKRKAEFKDKRMGLSICSFCSPP